MNEISFKKGGSENLWGKVSQDISFIVANFACFIFNYISLFVLFWCRNQDSNSYQWKRRDVRWPPNPRVNVIIKFFAQLMNAEWKHTDWMMLVTWSVLTNQSPLFWITVSTWHRNKALFKYVDSHLISFKQPEYIISEWLRHLFRCSDWLASINSNSLHMVTHLFSLASRVTRKHTTQLMTRILEFESQ